MLRQVKAMDFSLREGQPPANPHEVKASYTTKTETGKPVKAQEMDVALLVLYGHILYAGTSYHHSLSNHHRIGPALCFTNILV